MLNALIDLEVLLSYPFSHIPYCLNTPDGFFSKTNKASMLQSLMEDYNTDVQYPKDSMFIQDENRFFHTLINLPPTFGGIFFANSRSEGLKKKFYFLNRFSPSRFHENERKTTTSIWKTVHSGWINNEIN